MLLLNDVVEELSSFAEFEHQKADLIPFPNFVKLDNIWMVLKKIKQIWLDLLVPVRF